MSDITQSSNADSKPSSNTPSTPPVQPISQSPDPSFEYSNTGPVIPSFTPQIPINPPSPPMQPTPRPMGPPPLPPHPPRPPQEQPKPTAMNAGQIKIKMPPILWRQIQTVMSDLEKELGGSVVSYYTSSSIVGDDVKYFYTHLSSTGFQEKLYFILYTGGGEGTSAYRIASLLRSFCKELIIVIPEKAASAGTMLSLSGDTMMMTPLAYLTAVDTSVSHPLNPKDPKNNPVRVELEEVRNAVYVLEKNSTPERKNNIYEIIFNYIHPVAYGNMVRTSSLSERLCRELMSLRINPPDEAASTSLINMLNHELPTHGYPITREIAKRLGMPVVDTTQRLDDMLWRYINLNRALTEPVITDINDSYYHTEKYLNVIESVGRRLSVRQSHDERLDPIIKGWTTLKNIFKWEATYEKEVNGEKKIFIDTIDF